MKENQNIPPLEARMFLRACTRILGLTYMHNLFRISERAFCMWRSDKSVVSSDSIRENYIEKHEELLSKLMNEPDGAIIARAIVAKHANMTGCEIVIKQKVVPDKRTIEQECLDDYPALTKLHKVIGEEQKPDVVEYFGDKAKREIDETVVKYKTLTNK